MSNQVSIEKELKDGACIAVIGGGPSGSFFSYFALEFAKRLDLDISIDIYETKNFKKIGAGGCNHCGGIISESLIQELSTNGIVLPDNIIRRGIETYTLHVEQGEAIIDSPSHEQRIASVFRGCGPKGCTDHSPRSFDNFLLDLCKKNGANIIIERVAKVERAEDGIIIYSKKYINKKYDLLVGAAGLNAKTLDILKPLCRKYVPPKVTRTYISEFYLEKTKVDIHFSNSMHVFLLNLSRITFGALIPKENYVTLVLLGKDIDKEVVANFIAAKQVKGCFPKGLKLIEAAPCKCYPYINIKEAKNPMDDRVVLIGDSASSKLYKNGIGAAYITGRAAAKTAVFQGVSKESFEKVYQPIIRNINADNKIGKFIFFVTKFIQKSKPLKTGLIQMVIMEQKKESDQRWMSNVLWDTFTGSADYRNILIRFLNPQLLYNFIWNIISARLNQNKLINHEQQKARSPL